MLLLLFYAGSDCYGLDCSQIIEVIPQVPLKEIAHLPRYVAGLLNYRGKSIPILDMSLILGHRPSENHLHTRIVLFDFVSDESKSEIGIKMECVTETVKVDDNKFVRSGIKIKDLPYLTGTYVYEGKSIQFFDLPIFLNSLKTVLSG